MGCPVFARTPDQFPDLITAALQRADIRAWAAAWDIALVRARVNPYALRLTPIIDDVHHHVGEPAQRIIEEFLNQ